MRRIGIDVGGTNTDAVLLADGRVVHAVKTPTTADVTGGIVAALAVAAVFAPLDPSHEERARAILAEECPGAAVTLSHELGRIGLLERENASLLNAALAGLAQTTLAAFQDAIAASGIAAP